MTDAVNGSADSGARSEALGNALMAGALVSVLAAYILFYVYIPFDSTIRLVAFMGMFVFLVVLTALLILFDRWWKG
ncbi:MAG: hypothetical protein R3253_14305 [Longimicrobiales bacterium]|nr:hypothetical protein [Longimicrobiales bacterium]